MSSSSSSTDATSGSNKSHQCKQASQQEQRLQALPIEICQGIQCNDSNTNLPLQLECTVRLHDFMGTNEPCLIQQVINSGIVPHLVSLLGNNNKAATVHDRDHLKLLDDLKEETVLCLTEIAACGEPHQVQVLIQAGAINALVGLLSNSSSNSSNSSPRNDIERRANVYYALGNMCRLNDGGSTARNQALQAGVMRPLLEQLNESIRSHSNNSSSGESYQTEQLSLPQKKNLLHMALWALLGMLHGGQHWDLTQLQTALPTLLLALMELRDEIFLVWTCMSLSSVWSSCNRARNQAFQTAGVCQRLVEIVSHESSSPDVQRNALIAIAALLDGHEDSHKQVFLDLNILPSLLVLLSNISTIDQRVRRAACSVIGHLLMGNQNQLGQIIASSIIPYLVHLLHHSDVDIRDEAKCAFCRAMKRASRDQAKLLVNQLVLQECIQPISDLLLSSDLAMIRASLKMLDFILRAGHTNATTIGDTAALVRQAQGFDRMRNLRNHQDSIIRSRCLLLLEIYVDQDEASAIAPAA